MSSLGDFEYIGDGMVRYTGVLTDAMADKMRTPGFSVNYPHGADFRIEDYADVMAVAPCGARFIPPTVLQSLYPRALENEWNAELTPEKVEATWSDKVAEHLSERMRKSFFPHQRVAVVKFRKAKRLLVAHDMGLGKTATTVACMMYVLSRKRDARILVVCPKSLKLQWRSQIAHWSEDALAVRVRSHVSEIEDAKEARALARALKKRNAAMAAAAVAARSRRDFEDDDDDDDAVVEDEDEDEVANHTKPTISVVCYSVTSPKCQPLFEEMFGARAKPWDFVIFDESHSVFGSSTTAVTNMLALSKNSPGQTAKWLLLLTGSPPGATGLYAHMQMLYRGSMGAEAFKAEYCPDSRYRPELIHQTELREWFRLRSDRRSKDVELAGQLPPQTTEKVVLEIHEALLRDYRELERRRRELMSQMNADAPRAVFAALEVKRLTNEMYRALTVAKLPACKDWIRDNATELWEKHHQKTAVFSHYDSTRNDLQAFFPQHSVRVCGKTTSERVRFANISRLADKNDPEVRIGFLSNRSCGVGIQLVPAVTLSVVVEMDYNCAVDEQIANRAHRMGQEHPSRIVYLLAKDTMDMSIFDKVDDKYEAVSTIVDGHAKRRIVDTHTFVDARGAGILDAYHRWGLLPPARVADMRYAPAHGESFDGFLERAGVCGTLRDAHEAGLVDATAAMGLVATSPGVAHTRWCEVARGVSPKPPAGWMNSVAVVALIAGTDVDAARIAGLASGLERFRHVARNNLVVSVFAREGGAAGR